MNEIPKEFENVEVSVLEPCPNVLQVIDNLSVGGAQRLLFAFADSTDPIMNFRVVALKASNSGLADELRAQGVDVSIVGIGKLKSIASWWRVFKMLKTAPEPVVHLHLTYSIILCAPIAKSIGKKVVVSLHNVRKSSQKTFTKQLLSWLEAIVLRRFVDYYIAVGNAVLDSNLDRMGAAPRQVILNVIPSPSEEGLSESAAQLRQSLDARPGDLVLLSTGRLTPQKDHLTMLSAFAQVLQALPNSWLWIAGEGASKPMLEEVAENLGVADRVLFLGVRSDVEVLNAASDIFVLSSAWEGLPLALLEAMAQGVPVVSTRVGDVPDVLPPNAGFLVDTYDPKSFSAAIIKLGQDDELRKSMARNCRQVSKRFVDLGVWKTKIIKTYLQVMSD
ncbi:glycosyltransferase [Falsihalocynthiibacter sp. S25ZX9]|uniref:glycosyltransferase n=1 Tax=Falsihalocynthiibacter sp. S25ZX9 TaxID=3240870 RepID=UPI003510A78C